MDEFARADEAVDQGRVYELLRRRGAGWLLRTIRESSHAGPAIRPVVPLTFPAQTESGTMGRWTINATDLRIYTTYSESEVVEEVPGFLYRTPMQKIESYEGLLSAIYYEWRKTD